MKKSEEVKNKAFKPGDFVAVHAGPNGERCQSPAKLKVVSVTERAALLSDGRKVRHDGTVPNGSYWAERWDGRRHRHRLPPETMRFDGEIEVSECGIEIRVKILSPYIGAWIGMSDWYFGPSYRIPQDMTEEAARKFVAGGWASQHQDVARKLAGGDDLPSLMNGRETCPLTRFDLGARVIKWIWGEFCGPDSEEEAGDKASLIRDAGELALFGGYVEACRKALEYARAVAPEDESYYQKIDAILGKSDVKRCAGRFPVETA